jgi:ketosteroid isomerase-like protein
MGTLNAFVAAINAHSAEALAALMSPGHVFVDSAGKRAYGGGLARLFCHVPGLLDSRR